MRPLVSVVMPSYNQGRFITKALESVLGQSWRRVEVIVQDGGSSDDTLSILVSMSQKDRRLRWTSQSDNGPAQAINRALAKVRGTYIGWLNSDDEYAPGAIERAVSAMQDHPQWMLCYGQGNHIDENGNNLGRYPTLPVASGPIPGPQAFQNGCFICQPTVFFKAVMPRLIGPLDTTLGASFDFDYWLKAFKVFKGRIGCLAETQAHSRIHEHTITSTEREKVALEGMKVLARHEGYASARWLLSYLNELPEFEHAQAARNMLEKARPYMRQEEWASLRKQLSEPPAKQ